MTHLVYMDDNDKVNVGIDFSDRTEAARDPEHVKLEKGLQMWPSKH